LTCEFVAPVPWIPRFPSTIVGAIPSRVSVGIHRGIEVYHPRYVLTPKVGMSMYGFMMFASTHSFLKALRRSYPFDLIDAHYIYPDGLAAVLHGQRLACRLCCRPRI